MTITREGVLHFVEDRAFVGFYANFDTALRTLQPGSTKLPHELCRGSLTAIEFTSALEDVLKTMQAAGRSVNAFREFRLSKGRVIEMSDNGVFPREGTPSFREGLDHYHKIHNGIIALYRALVRYRQAAMSLVYEFSVAFQKGRKYTPSQTEYIENVLGSAEALDNAIQLLKPFVPEKLSSDEEKESSSNAGCTAVLLLGAIALAVLASIYFQS